MRHMNFCCTNAAEWPNSTLGGIGLALAAIVVHSTKLRACVENFDADTDIYYGCGGASASRLLEHDNILHNEFTDL